MAKYQLVEWSRRGGVLVVVLGCLCCGIGCGPTTDAAMAAPVVVEVVTAGEAYEAVFWGTMVYHNTLDGRFPFVRQTRAIIGMAPKECGLPSRDSLAPLPLDRTSLSYVEGRRYIVFLRHPTEEERQKSMIAGSTRRWDRRTARRVVRIVDLDETPADIEVRELLTWHPIQPSLPFLFFMFVTKPNLQEWMSSVQEKFIEGDVSISDVTYVLGMPHRLDGQWSEGEGLQASVVYVIPSPHFTGFEDGVLYSSDLVFDVADGRATGLSLVRNEWSIRSLPNLIPRRR